MMPVKQAIHNIFSLCLIIEFIDKLQNQDTILFGRYFKSHTNYFLLNKIICQNQEKSISI